MKKHIKFIIVWFIFVLVISTTLSACIGYNLNKPLLPIFLFSIVVIISVVAVFVLLFIIYEKVKSNEATH